MLHAYQEIIGSRMTRNIFYIMTSLEATSLAREVFFCLSIFCEKLVLHILTIFYRFRLQIP